MALFYENKVYVLKSHVSEINNAITTPKEIDEHKQLFDDATKVVCIRISTMALDLQKPMRTISPIKLIWIWLKCSKRKQEKSIMRLSMP